MPPPPYIRFPIPRVAVPLAFLDIWGRAGAPILILSLGMAGYYAHIGARLYILEQSLCATYYESHQPERSTLDASIMQTLPTKAIGHNMGGIGGRIPEHMCKVPEIQAELVSLVGMIDTLQLVPGLLVGVMWERLSLTIGRKTVLTLSSLGSALGLLYFMAICFFDTVFDIKWVIFMCIFDVIGGGWVTSQSLLYTYITERVEADSLAKYFYNISAWLLATRNVGMFSASWLMGYEGGAWIATVIGLVLEIFSMFSCYLLPNVKSLAQPIPEDFSIITNPKKDRKIPYITTSPVQAQAYDTFSPSSSSSSATLLVNDDSKIGVQTKSSLLDSMMRDFCQTISITYNILVRDKFSRLCMGSYFVYCVYLSIRGIMPQYASTGFGWTLADADVLWGFEHIVSIITLLAIPLITRKKTSKGTREWRPWGKDKDIFIMLFTALVSGIGIVMMGFAAGKASYIVSLVLLTVGYSGLPDSLRSFAQREIKSMDKGTLSRCPNPEEDAEVAPMVQTIREDEDEDDDVSFLALDDENIVEEDVNNLSNESLPLLSGEIINQQEGTVRHDEGEKLSQFFIGFSLVENLGYLIGTPLWSGLYALTLRESWNPSWIFVECACFCGICAMMVLLTEDFTTKRWMERRRTMREA